MNLDAENLKGVDLEEFLDTLPFMYARYEVLRDENNFIRDARCIGSNSIFRDYYKVENPIGMLRSSFLKDSTPFWNFHAVKCLAGSEIEAWQYNGTSLGELNVIMRRVGDECIDVYTINMDKDRRMERERRMEYQEILKAKYLCGVKIWHWRLGENKVYSKDSLYGEEAFCESFDEDRGYLVWDADEIFGKLGDEAERKSFDSEVASLIAGEKERADIYVHTHATGKVVRIIMMMMVEERDVLGQATSIIGCTRIASIQ